MERLTKRYGHGMIGIGDPLRYYNYDDIKHILEHLATIEDILGDDYDLDRLRELVKADQEGRCVVLPCKVGDKVFQQNGVDIFESQVKKIIYDCGHFAFDEEAIGERVFLTREAAKAAQKGE